MLLASETFLEANGITYEDLDVNEGDEVIAAIALCLVEYIKDMDETSISLTRTTVGGCILQAVGVKEILTEPTVKLAAKAIGKAVCKKAVPYIGWGLFAIDFVACVVE